MKPRDVEKLKKARRIIMLLIEGINPIDYTNVPENDILNDPKLIRIFSYIAMVLSDDIDEQLAIEAKELKKITEVINAPSLEEISKNYKDINKLINSLKIGTFK